MIDAYTIGITIALEDGVSAGLATIRADLATLDRTIAGTAAGLLALRRLGQQISLIGPGDARPVPSSAPPPGRPTSAAVTGVEAAQPSDATVSKPGLTQPGAQTAPNRMPSAAPAAMPDAPLPPSAPAMERQNIAPRTRVSVLAAPSGEAAEPRPRAASEFAPRQPVSAPRVIPDLPMVRPTLADTSLVRDRNQQLPTGAFVPEIADVAARAISPRAGLDAARLPTVRFETAAPPTPSFQPASPPPSQQAAPPPVRLNRPEPSIEVLPTVIPPSGPAAPAVKPRPAWGSKNRVSRAAPEDHAIAEASQPPPRLNGREGAADGLSGEINLDGVRLGRWMADSLARMSERPPSGSTGIDPRATPSWPAMPGD